MAPPALWVGQWVGQWAGRWSGPAAPADEDPVRQAVPFHGDHQAGILTPRQPAVGYVALDVTAASRAELLAVLRSLTVHARRLAVGGRPPELGVTAPPADSGVVGPVVPPGRLTVTVALGSTFYDHHGLMAHKPIHLRRMDTFPDDRLDPAQCHGDVLIQVCADDADLAHHGIRDLLRAVRGGLQPRWRVDGFIGPARPTGVPRNLFGFNDGIANPSPAEDDALVWPAPASRPPQPVAATSSCAPSGCSWSSGTGSPSPSRSA